MYRKWAANLEGVVIVDVPFSYSDERVPGLLYKKKHSTLNIDPTKVEKQ